MAGEINSVTVSVVEEMRKSLETALIEAVGKAVASGQMPTHDLPGFVVEVPKERGHGDFATNLAMQLPKLTKLPPIKIAEIIVQNLNLTVPWLEQVEIAKPGFINFILDPRWTLAAVTLAVQRGEDYGRLAIGGNKKVQVEFVSANPTGLLHMGNARGAALGDSIASILAFAGWQVSREYYINDAGNQIDNFALSLEARYFILLGLPGEIPEGGYHGQDIADTMSRYIAIHGDALLQAEKRERLNTLVQFALTEKIAGIKKTLSDFGVHYDCWFSEQTLHDSGKINQILEQLSARGYLYEKDGAQWFKATEFGLEKDEVLVRQNGLPTYYAADIAYHKDKFDRGFERVINIWGADHHGHVARMKSAMQALGYDPESLQVLLMQLVRLFSDGELIKMSKRTGKFVTLEELVDDIGLDAAHYFFTMRSADSQMDFNLDLAREQSNDNPVFYVQYAYARICSIFRQLDNQGIQLPEKIDGNVQLLVEEAELALARHIAGFPEEVALSARQLAPHRITRYVHEVAGLLHSFYNSHRVISDNLELTSARLMLVEAARVVLRNSMALLGVSAPEKM